MRKAFLTVTTIAAIAAIGYGLPAMAGNTGGVSSSPPSVSVTPAVLQASDEALPAAGVTAPTPTVTVTVTPPAPRVTAVPKRVEPVKVVTPVKAPAPAPVKKVAPAPAPVKTAAPAPVQSDADRCRAAVAGLGPRILCVPSTDPHMAGGRFAGWTTEDGTIRVLIDHNGNGWRQTALHELGHRWLIEHRHTPNFLTTLGIGGPRGAHDTGDPVENAAEGYAQCVLGKSHRTTITAPTSCSVISKAVALTKN